MDSIDTLVTRDGVDVSLTGFLEKCPSALLAISQHGGRHNLCHPDIRTDALASLRDMLWRSGVPQDLQFAIVLPTVKTTLHFSSVVGSGGYL